MSHLFSLERDVAKRILVLTAVSAALSLFFTSVSLLERFSQFLGFSGPPSVLRFAGYFALLFLAGFLWLSHRRARGVESRHSYCADIISSVGPDVLLVTDSDRNIVMCSGSVKKVFGYEVSEVINQKTELLYPDRRSKPGQKFEIYHILELEGIHTGVATGKKKDGDLIPLEISTSLLSGHGGVVLMIRDMSKRKRTEDVLKRERTFLSTVLDVAGALILVLDREARVLRSNKAFERMTGRPGSEVKGRFFWDLFVNPENVKLIKSAFEKLPSGEFPVAHEHHMETKDGARRTILWSSSVMLDTESATEYIVCVGTDVTDRCRVDSKLRESEERYRVLVDHAEEAIILADTKGNLIDANIRALQRLGYPKEQLMGMHVNTIYRAADGEKVQAFLRETFQRGSGSMSRSTIVRGNGETVVVETSGRLIAYDGKAVVRLIFTDHEVHEQREEMPQPVVSEKCALVETAQDFIWSLDTRLRLTSVNEAFRKFFLLAYGVELEIGTPLMRHLPVELRTSLAMLYNQAMKGESLSVDEQIVFNESPADVEISCSPIVGDDGRIAGAGYFARDISDRKKAESEFRNLLKEKEVLLKEAYHRIKNNLQVVSSLLSIQSEHIRDKETLEIFKESLNRVKSMAMIHESLFQSKDITKIDFGEYLRNVANYLFRSYGVDTKLIRLRITAGAVHMSVNQALPCGLIINELMTNSLKHAFPGGKEGEVYVDVRVNGEAAFTVIVGDTGVGLPKDFDFKQAKSIGLQLVNTLVHQLRGNIEFHGTGGTEFTMRFPVSDQRAGV